MVKQRISQTHFGKTYISQEWLKSRSVEDRQYQTRILQTARQKNTLVVLPTALGKTVIALLLALEQIDKGRVYFLAPTRPLVQQHYASFKDKTLLEDKRLILVTGMFPPAKRIGLYKSGKIVFATPQCVWNDLKKRRLNLNDASLIIFDEAHRARGNYAYVGIAQAYFHQSPRPLILGLTASPGGYEAKIVDVCRNLGVEAIEYRTEEDPDVKAYIQPINLDWRRLTLPEAYLQVRDSFNELLTKLVKSLQSFGVLSGKGSTFVSRRDLVELNQTIQHRLENGEGGYLYNLKVQTTAALSVMHMIVLIETQGPETLIPFIEKTLTRMAAEGSRGHKLIINSPLFKQAKQTLIRCLALENPKVAELVKVILQQYTKKQTSRIIVFTQYRDTVLVLLSVLRKKLDLIVSRFVGQGFREGDPGMTQKQQRVALENLRNGTIHVLIATSIAEEGLDIPEVDHVVFYEPVPSEIRYIQRRGRTGRRVAGKVTILIAKKTLDEAFYWSSMRKTKKMKTTIKQLNTRLPQMLKKPIGLPPRQHQRKLPSYLISEQDPSLNESAEDIKGELWKPQSIKGAGISQILTWLIANLPEEPTTIPLLVETAVKETNAEKGVVEAAIWRLIQQGYLYQRSPGEIIKL